MVLFLSKSKFFIFDFAPHTIAQSMIKPNIKQKRMTAVALKNPIKN
jgi:hypothetical protein